MAFEVFDGYIVAGGQFPAVQSGSKETIARCIAAWDGISWSPLGDGLEGLSWWGQACVSDLMVLDGRLLAGGMFRRSGETELRNIAGWNGESWTSVGSGVNGRVYALTVYNGTLVAGGGFTEAGGIEANHVARWTGSEWAPFGSGVDFDVKALQVDGEYLYVGGKFKVAGGKASYHMARWEDRFPGMVLGFRAARADTAIRLEWTNPSAEVFEGTLIRFSQEAYPGGPSDGEPVPNGDHGRFLGHAGRDTSFIHCGLGNGGAFYYTAFAFDDASVYSAPAHAYVEMPDIFAPALSVAVFQNPYLYILGSEALDPGSVELHVNAEAIEVAPVDSSGKIWFGNYKLKPTDDSLTVSVCASDCADNRTCTSSQLRSCFVGVKGCREIRSPDDRLRLVIDRGTPAPNTYALVMPCSRWDTEMEAAPPRNGVCLAERSEDPAGYRIGPSGLLASNTLTLLRTRRAGIHRTISTSSRMAWGGWLALSTSSTMYSERMSLRRAPSDWFTAIPARARSWTSPFLIRGRPAPIRSQPRFH